MSGFNLGFVSREGAKSGEVSGGDFQGGDFPGLEDGAIAEPDRAAVEVAAHQAGEGEAVAPAGHARHAQRHAIFPTHVLEPGLDGRGALMFVVLVLHDRVLGKARNERIRVMGIVSGDERGEQGWEAGFHAPMITQATDNLMSGRFWNLTQRRQGAKGSGFQECVQAAEEFGLILAP